MGELDPQDAARGLEVWLGPSLLINDQLVAQTQGLQLQGEAAAEGEQAQSEEGAHRISQRGEHRTDSRRLDWQVVST
jgi:hypothetical protein